MRRILIFVFYSFFLIILGRNLTFLPQVGSIDPSKPQDIDVLREETIEFLDAFEGQFSIYYEDLKTGDSFGVKENAVLTAASLNKLPIVFYLYSLANLKEVDLEEKIIIQSSDIQDYGTGIIRYEDPGGSYTLKRLSELSFKHSDNTAAHILIIKLEEANIQEYARIIGLISTDIAGNKTSARDIGRMFSLLYNNEITNEALTLELLDYLKDTEFEDRMALYLSDEAIIYHKVGDAVGLIHDAGIIDDGKDPFILVVLANEIEDEDATKEAIGQIAQFIYDARKK